MYWLELHIHTEIGSLDSTLNFDSMISEYKRIGVDGVCVTEHINWKHLDKNEYENLYGAFERGKEIDDFDIFPGAEVKLPNDYEYLVLGVKIPYELFGLDWEEAIKKIHDLGGIVIKSHPYREEDEVIPIDGIEMFNFHSSVAKNKKSLVFAEENNELVSTVGCDAHSDDVTGMAITVLDKRPENGKELVEMLVSGHIDSYIINGKECKKEDIHEKLFNGSFDRRF